MLWVAGGIVVLVVVAWYGWCLCRVAGEADDAADALARAILDAEEWR